MRITIAPVPSGYCVRRLEKDEEGGERVAENGERRCRNEQEAAKCLLELAGASVTPDTIRLSVASHVMRAKNTGTEQSWDHTHLRAWATDRIEAVEKANADPEPPAPGGEDTTNEAAGPEDILKELVAGTRWPAGAPEGGTFTPYETRAEDSGLGYIVDGEGVVLGEVLVDGAFLPNPEPPGEPDPEPEQPEGSPSDN